MSIDKSKDDELFNCHQKHEIDYVVSRYNKIYSYAIIELIDRCCNDGTFNNSKHSYVYKKIEDELGIERER